VTENNLSDTWCGICGSLGDLGSDRFTSSSSLRKHEDVAIGMGGGEGRPRCFREGGLYRREQDAARYPHLLEKDHVCFTAPSSSFASLSFSRLAGGNDILHRRLVEIVEGQFH